MSGGASSAALKPGIPGQARRKWGRPSQEQIILLVTLLIAGCFAVILPGFATAGNLMTLARSVAILGILALGMSIVVIGRGIDLSQVAIMALSSATTVMMLGSGLAMPWAMAGGLGLAAALGALNGAVVAFVEVPALFATLASAFVFYGVGQSVLKALVLYVPADAAGFLYLGQGRPFGVPMQVVIFAVTAVLVHLLLAHTAVGRFIYAHGDNPEAARLSGVAVRPLALVQYGLSGAIGWLAGVVMAGATTQMSLHIIDSTYIFDAILVVVLGGISLVGGRGGVASVVVGTALVGTLLNGLTIMDVNNEVQDIMKGVVLLAAIILDNRLHPRDEETARQGD